MTQLCKRMFHFNIKRRTLWQVSILRRYLRSILNRFLACCSCKSSIRYRQLSRATTTTTVSSAFQPSSSDRGFSNPRNIVSSQRYSLDHGRDSTSDLVPLKITLFGDSHIGKTSFLTKYVGGEKGEEEFGRTGICQMDKTLIVRGARISYSIWEVCGDDSSHDHIPAAILQNAIPVLVGTKFDDFVQLPIDPGFERMHSTKGLKRPRIVWKGLTSKKLG